MKKLLLLFFLCVAYPAYGFDVHPNTGGVTFGNSSELRALLSDATGTGLAVFQGGALGVASATSLSLTGTAGAGFAEYIAQSSAPSAPASGFREYADSTGRKSWIRASDGFTRTWDATLTANRVYTLQDGSGTLAFLGDKLSAFAATTSAELAGAITNETGTAGLLVYSLSPALTTPGITTGINDANSVRILDFTPTASATQNFAMTNSIAAGTPTLSVTAPPQVTAGVAGTNVGITASAATAGSGTAGAAAGGSVTITTGAAARLTSGNATGGDINLVTGAGVGTGTAGQVIFPTGTSGFPALTFAGDTNTGLFWVSSDRFAAVSGGLTRLDISSTFVTLVTASAYLGIGNGNIKLYANTAAELEMGTDAAAAVAQTFKAHDGSGTDKAGADLTVAGGNGTGTGVGGIVKINNSFAAVGSASSQNAALTTVQFATGHIESANTAPTIGGSCGTSPAIVGTDVAGKVTTGTVAPTSCTVTFAKAWTNAPACFANNETNSNLQRATSTTTTLTIAGTMVASDVITYVCIGRI